MKHDIIIIGAGIVGLSSALKLKELNPDLSIMIIDKEETVSSHQTGHNSGVIHSGLYYPPNSLKAENCLNGYRLLVDFCSYESIPFELCGKVIVATSQEEIPRLKALFARGIANGLEGIKTLTSDEIKAYEPHVYGLEGLYVPQTGIVDYSMISNKIEEKLKQNNTAFCLGEKVIGIDQSHSQNTVITDMASYESRLVINCAGLYSDKIAGFAGESANLKIIPFRGEYYKLVPEKEYLVKNLIYPVPDPGFPFLGVHFTRMIQGGVEAGPNAVLAYKREGYKKSDVNIAEFTESLMWPGFQKVARKYWRTGLGEFYRSYSKKAFTRALKKLIPEIQEKDLISGGSGVRAQACTKEGGLVDDFLVRESKLMINVLNAPSPAATSSLSIGETIARLGIRHF